MFKIITINLLLVGSLRIPPIDNNNNFTLDVSKKVNETITIKNNKLDEFIKTVELKQQQEQQAKAQQPNLLCANNKYITYTNIDNIDLNWDYIDLDNYYIDDNGMVREVGTNAIACAMATNYNKGGYYNITLNNGTEVLVKVVDTKADTHTTNACYTTHDNSILELWLTNSNHDLRYIGNSKVKNIFVTEINEKN